MYMLLSCVSLLDMESRLQSNNAIYPCVTVCLCAVHNYKKIKKKTLSSLI